MTAQAEYFSYLLRIWRTSDGDQDIWRASLEQPGTRQHQGFATLDELFDHIRAQIASRPEEAGSAEAVGRHGEPVQAVPSRRRSGSEETQERGMT